METDAEQLRVNSKYYVCTSEKMGRYVAASRDLKVGEVVMSEPPLAVGPACDAPLLCFSCHAPLAGKFSCCATCRRAPVCAGRICQQSEAHTWHDQAECSLFRSSAHLSAVALVNKVGALLPLRCLLKRRSDPRSWERLINMEHHLEERRGSDIWKYHEGTVEFINSLGLGESHDDGDLIQKVCGIVDVNSFELRGPLSTDGLPQLILRGVYPEAALMAHHCVGNTHVAIGADQALTVRAARDIAQGEVICYNYVDALEDTARRQERLRIGKYFTCECERCLDPTEFSTHVGSVACPACRVGLLIPPTPVKIGKGSRDNKSDTSHDTNQVIANYEATENSPHDAKIDTEKTSSDIQEDNFESKLIISELVGLEDTSGSSIDHANGIIQVNNNDAKTDADRTSRDIHGDNLESKLIKSELVRSEDTICTSTGQANGFVQDDYNNAKTDAERTSSYREENLEFKLVKSDLVLSEDTNGKTTSHANGIVEDDYNIKDAEDDTLWSCQDCKQKFQREPIECKVKACSRKFECIDKSSEAELSEYVEKVSLILSRRHYLVLAAQQALAGALRVRIQHEERPSTRLLRHYTQLCSELLHVLQLLRPTVSREIAITLYELQAASVMLARKLYEAREITAEAYLTELASGQELLKRSTAMLVLEPSGSPEGALCARALQELRDLRAASLAITDAAATKSQTYSANS